MDYNDKRIVKTRNVMYSNCISYYWNYIVINP